MAKAALLIGVSEYEPGLNPLPAAVKDIEAMQQVLLDPRMGGFDQVKLLANPDPQAMQYEIETLFSGRVKDDLVLLFFSGHGIKDDSGRLYFATRITRKNVKGDLIRSTAVPANFVHDIMNNSRCRRQAIILDCCFSGAFDPALQAKDDGSVDLRNQLGAEGRVVLTSSSSTEYSFEQQGAELSLYTRYLVEGMETGAGDLNEDGFVSVLELHEYASSKVQETAPNMTPKIITLRDKGFEIVLAKARVADPKLKYRKEAQRYASRGEISKIGRMALDTLRIQLGLSSDITNEIEDEVLRPYLERLENLQRYQQAFVSAIEQEQDYPFSSETQTELEDLCKILGFRKEDVTLLEEATLKEIANQKKVYQEKLQQYKQEFLNAVQIEYPINEHVRGGLRNFQKFLELKQEDIEEIEKPVLAKKEVEYLQQQEDKLRKEKQQEYQQNLRYYEQEFLKAIQQEYPFSESTYKKLKDLQLSLKLQNEDMNSRELQLAIEQQKEKLRHSQLEAMQQPVQDFEDVPPDRWYKEKEGNQSIWSRLNRFLFDEK